MKEAAKRLLRDLTYRLGYQNLDHLTLLLESRIRKVNEFFVVQIGANDGTTYDPIHGFVMTHRDKVRGVMLEPLPDVYQQLEETYRDHPGIRTLQVAIHNTERSMQLYRVDPARVAELPSFVKGIASFDPEYHRKSNTPSELIVSETVPCITFDELLRSHEIKKVDLLCIDTEGYDAEIIRGMDLGKVMPSILYFEHGLRDGVMPEAVFAEVMALLNRLGYDVFVGEYDVIAHVRGQLAI